MERLRPRRPSPALVISLIALFVALSGTAYALATNSIGARELKPIVVREMDQTIAPHTTRVIDLQCHRGEQVTGGGIEEVGHASATDVEDSHPRRDGWEASVTNNDGVPHVADTEVLCLTK
jgi:hypothetical protein